MTERTPQSLNVMLQSVRECRLTQNQVFRLWKCAVKDDDKLVDAVIEKLYEEMIAFDIARAETVMQLIIDRDEAALPTFRDLLQDMTLSGDASATSGGIYTLSSIAAVVIGGTSLMGGVGGAVGSIFGAFVLREVSDLLFVFDIQPLVQPFIQGLILLGAVSLGAIRVLRAHNRLEFLGVGR